MEATSAPPGRCITCGRELGGDPHWITKPPDGEHDDCREWKKWPAPYGPDLDRLRRVAWRLRRAYEVTVATGRMLKQMHDEWPARAGERVGAYEERRRKLREVLAALERLRL